MKDQTEEAFAMFGDKLEGSVSSPATTKLNTVDSKATQLDNKKSDISLGSGKATIHSKEGKTGL